MGNCFAGATTTDEVKRFIIPERYTYEYYKTLYDCKFNLLKNKSTQVGDLDNFFVFEFTPQGNVIMKYDTSDEVFYYYCDRSIPNHILEVVAKRYSIAINSNHLFEKEEEGKKDDDDADEKKDCLLYTSDAADE